MTAPAPAVPTKTTPRRRLRPVWLMVLIALVLILTALNLILVLIQTAYRPSDATPGALLYATRFDNPAAPDWYQYSSSESAQIADHSLALTANDSGKTIFSPLQFPFHDFDIRVNVRHVLEDPTDPLSEYGILFRYQNPQNYEMFKVRFDGAYHIEQAINGTAIDLSAPHPAPSFAMGQGSVNDLRVVAVGDHFQFYLNGQLLTLCLRGSDKYATWNGDQCMSNGGKTSTTLIDSTFPDGQIALGVQDDQSPMQVNFSDVLVLSPQNP